MPGRKKPDVTESEREREYWLEQKRGYGEKVVGEGGEFLDELGPKAEVARKRDAWHEAREKNDG